MTFRDYYKESLEIEASGVYENDIKIADIEIDEMPGVTKEEVIGYFVDEEDDNPEKDPVIKYIKSLKLPKKFTYVWLQFIKLLPGQRGKGKGSEIINTLALQYPPGTVIALSAEEISGGKSSLEMVKKFYKQNGFTLIRSRDKVFGFRVV
jgi:hypothetical protein